jgi:hypothetical protein
MIIDDQLAVLWIRIYLASHRGLPSSTLGSSTYFGLEIPTTANNKS